MRRSEPAKAAVSGTRIARRKFGYREPTPTRPYGALFISEGAPGDETEVAKGVKAKILGEGPAMIPGFKTVRLQDVTFQPGSSNPEKDGMKNPMVCHITEGELQITQDGGKPFTAKKNFVWTCNTGTTEGSTNSGSVVAVMRIMHLLTA